MTTMETPQKRPCILGMSIGTFWLIAASAGFSSLELATARTSNTRMALGGILVLALMLLTLTFTLIRTAMKLPVEPRTAERRRTGRRFALIFALIVVLEIVGFAVVNAVAWSTGHVSMMVALDQIIVGAHFFPLARLFGVPRYNLLGFCSARFRC